MNITIQEVSIIQLKLLYIHFLVSTSFSSYYATSLVPKIDGFSWGEKGLGLEQIFVWTPSLRRI